MDIEQLADRANRLLAFQRDEVTKALRAEVRRCIGDYSARGIARSSIAVQGIQEIFEKQLPVSAKAAWDILHTTHDAMGRDTEFATRNAMKAWLKEAILLDCSQFAAMLASSIQPLTAGLQVKIPQVDYSGTGAAMTSKYFAVIDNYMDQIINAPKGNSGITINAQNVGAVVTGNEANIHITQNSEAAEKMRDLLPIIRSLLAHAESISEQKRGELIAIADETGAELEKAQPNEVKLLTYFSVLAQAIQTLPAAPAAYDSIKTLLAPFGMNLP